MSRGFPGRKSPVFFTRVPDPFQSWDNERPAHGKDLYPDTPIWDKQEIHS